MADFGPTGIGSTNIGPYPFAFSTGRHTSEPFAGQLRRRHRTEVPHDFYTGRRIGAFNARRYRTEPWHADTTPPSRPAITPNFPAHRSTSTVIRGAQPVRRRIGTHHLDDRPETNLLGPTLFRERLFTDTTEESYPTLTNGLRNRRLYYSEPSPRDRTHRNGPITTGFRRPYHSEELPCQCAPLIDHDPSDTSSAGIPISCSFCGAPFSPVTSLGPPGFCNTCAFPSPPTRPPKGAKIARMLPERLRAWQQLILIFIWCLLMCTMEWVTRKDGQPGTPPVLVSLSPRTRAMGFTLVSLMILKSYDIIVETPPAVTLRQYTLGAMVISRTVRTLLIGIQILYVAFFTYMVIWLVEVRREKGTFAEVVSTFMLQVVLDFEPRRVVDLYLYVILGVLNALVTNSFFALVMAVVMAWDATPRWVGGSVLVLLRRRVGFRIVAIAHSVAGWVWFLLMYVLFTMLIILDVLSLGVEFWHLRYDWYQHVTPWGIAGGTEIDPIIPAAPAMVMV
ncbi:hypothetical protein P152DRAFT_474030 [Eremomyces bilateralis CBS 781.70]|uniref:Uncharacterized protein n=1 Tax=Eremomyces bilateralis CBS 781.70 TaxID=1392243 RepID=A0A6G1G3E1_9PEZI|nr:uncharacterized protein P152DRAFT_474030 [Eremomyces bilateralis CBS 781.70]KAF1812329.1 hypothetical protein P152DRAFT_474030 [Eremomyces bilateralis CBS 781.70]